MQHAPLPSAHTASAASIHEGCERPLSLRERQRHEREELILRTAEEMLIERGYHETSLDEIAARVGIAKGTIYLHFASKEDLVFALVERNVQHFLTALDAILSGQGSARERLQQVIKLVYDSSAEGRFHQLIAMLQSPELMGRFADHRARFAELWEEPQRRLGAVFDEGKAAGEFDANLPTAVMVSLFGGLIRPHSYHRLVVNEQLAPEEVVGYLSSFFFRGIGSGCEQAPSAVDR